MAAAAAGPVYRLLGKKDLGTNEFPPIETDLVNGDIAWRQHSGGHTTGPNWPAFIQFASRYFDSKQLKFFFFLAILQSQSRESLVREAHDSIKPGASAPGSSVDSDREPAERAKADKAR